MLKYRKSVSCEENMYTKKCNKCGNEYPIEHYAKHPSTADKRQNQCRPCRNIIQTEYRNKIGPKEYMKYEKTQQGFLMRAYRNMKSRVTGIQKAKYHLYDHCSLLDKELFYKWAWSDSNFIMLYQCWILANRDRKLTPSVDRIDSSKGYDLSNMRWITHSENSRQGSLNRWHKQEIL